MRKNINSNEAREFAIATEQVVVEMFCALRDAFADLFRVRFNLRAWYQQLYMRLVPNTAWDAGTSYLQLDRQMTKRLNSSFPSGHVPSAGTGGLGRIGLEVS